MEINQQMADRVREIVVFCLKHRGRCWRGWSAEKIFKYVGFHVCSGTIVVTGEPVSGVAIGWTSSVAEIIRRDRSGEPQFAWSTIDEGRALLICEVFGNKQTSATLWRMALEKWPFINRIFTYRSTGGKRQELVELSFQKLARFGLKGAV